MRGLQNQYVEQGLCSPAEAALRIEQGHYLLLAGREAELATLPSGCWIGGTVAKFVGPQGGTKAAGQIYYADFTNVAEAVAWRSFDAQSLPELAQYYPPNGFAILLIPGCSQILGILAGGVMNYENIYDAPLTGWVSAVPLAERRHMRPKVFAGGPEPHDERAAVMYVSLPQDMFAQLHIANLFSPGDGPDIQFLSSSPDAAQDCLIGGVRRNLDAYRVEARIDMRLPLVTDQDGALLNIGLLPGAEPGGALSLLAPVSPELTYRFAETVRDYADEFGAALAALDYGSAANACVCVLNYLHAGLEHARGLDFTAPVTFGQIAYTVLNQTFVCLEIGRHEAMEDAGGAGL